MSCNPERVTGYVDGALGPAETTEVEAHLEGCLACREQVDAERRLRERMGALPPIELRPGFEADVRRSLQRTRGARPWLLPAAAALALAALWVRGAPSFVAWEVARDHSHCFAKASLPAKIWSSDPLEVTAWFEEQGTRLPVIPASAHGLQLIGARYCPLGDRIAAHLYFAGDRRHLSLFVLAGPARLRGDYATTVFGQPVRLLRAGGTVVALVSKHAEDVEAFRETFRTTVARLEHPGPATPGTPGLAP
jgi:anti-sigma factor RsiW